MVPLTVKLHRKQIYIYIYEKILVLSEKGSSWANGEEGDLILLVHITQKYSYKFGQSYRSNFEEIEIQFVKRFL